MRLGRKELARTIFDASETRVRRPLRVGRPTKEANVNTGVLASQIDDAIQAIQARAKNYAPGSTRSKTADWRIEVLSELKLLYSAAALNGRVVVVPSSDRIACSIAKRLSTRGAGDSTQENPERNLDNGFFLPVLRFVDELNKLYKQCTPSSNAPSISLFTGSLGKINQGVNANLPLRILQKMRGASARGNKILWRTQDFTGLVETSNRRENALACVQSTLALLDAIGLISVQPPRKQESTWVLPQHEEHAETLRDLPEWKLLSTIHQLQKRARTSGLSLCAPLENLRRTLPARQRKRGFIPLSRSVTGLQGGTPIRLLRTLEAAGLITRFPVETNFPVFFGGLTPRGTKIVLQQLRRIERGKGIHPELKRALLFASTVSPAATAARTRVTQFEPRPFWKKSKK